MDGLGLYHLQWNSLNQAHHTYMLVQLRVPSLNGDLSIL